MSTKSYFEEHGQHPVSGLVHAGGGRPGRVLGREGASGRRGARQIASGFAEWLRIYNTVAGAARNSLSLEKEPVFVVGLGFENVFHVRRAPLKCMQSVYGQGIGERISDLLEEWVHLAITSETENSYDDGPSRRRLIAFCRDLQKLADAWSLIVFRLWKMQQHVPSYMSVPDAELLDDAEWQDPVAVLQCFRDRYSWQESWGELWNLLDAVISYEGDPGHSRMNLLITFEFLFCLAEASRYYTPSDAECTAAKEHTDPASGTGYAAAR